MTIRLQSAYRYLTTYLVLLKHFAGSRGIRFAGVVLAVLVQALLHPIPFLLLAELLRGGQAGARETVLGWHGYTISLQPDLAVFAVFALGTATYVLGYFVSVLVNRETVAWQGQMFWTLAAGFAGISRWDRSTELGVHLNATAVSLRIDTALRGAFPIGRLIETGLRDFVLVIALLSILIWLDAREVAVLGFITLLFLPAYGAAIARLVRSQAKSNAQMFRLRQPVISLLSSDLTRKSGRAIDAASIPRSVTRVLSQGFGSQSALLNEQNAVTVVAGVHVFAAFYGVYLSAGRSLASLPAGNLSFLFFLVLMLRSLISLIGLISRLSRGYERLGLLRSLLFPVSKPVLAKSTAPGGSQDGCFAVSVPTAHADGPAVKRTLQPGDTVLFLAPDVSFGFQLLPLANALQPLWVADGGRTRQIPLLGLDDVPGLMANGIVTGETASLRLPGAGQIILRPEPMPLSTAPVVALSLPAWQRLVRDGGRAIAGRDRVLVIAAQGRRVPVTTPTGAFVVLSDGRVVVAAGELAAMKEHLAELVASGLAGAKVVVEEEESEGEV